MKFSSILGHGKEIERLKKAVRSKRIAHAYLFSGPDGIGKRLVAESFAAALNCADFSDDSCGVCRSCEMFDAGSHTNLCIIEPEEDAGTTDEAEELQKAVKKRKRSQPVLKIEAIRGLQRALRYRVESGTRVAVVDGAQCMTRNTANALLKTLEEPPEGSIVALLSSEPDSLLPTVLSRCQRINFRPLPFEVVKKALVEKKGMSIEAANLIARLCAGSLAWAYEAASEGALEKRKAFFGRFLKLDSGDIAGILDFSAAISKEDSPDEAMEFLKDILRDILVSGAGCPELVLNSDMAGFLKGASVGAAGGKDWFNAVCEAFAFAEDARTSMLPPRYANKNLAMDALFIRIFKGAVGRRAILKQG
ncbi:MAG: DNA polymerase III subunit delta' [Thermodesulfobacteriota bacterium]